MQTPIQPIDFSERLDLDQRQTHTERALFNFSEYTVDGFKRRKNQGRSICVEGDLAGQAKFHLERNSDVYTLGNAGSPYAWFSAGASKHVPQRIMNAGDALNAAENFVFPSEIRANANKASRHLTDVFQEVSRRIVMHDQLTGRVDRRKNLAIAKGMATGNLNVEEIRPYRRTLQAPVTLPHVAIVANAANIQMWSDEHYIPRMVELTLAIQWACEASGLTVTAAMVDGLADGCLDARCGYDAALRARVLARPYQTVSLKSLVIAFHRDLWRWGNMNAEAADPDSTHKIAALYGRMYDRHFPSTGWSSRDGGYAVTWARQGTGADLVIAIGDIVDAKDADIQLSSDLSLGKAVMEIADKARTFRSEVE